MITACHHVLGQAGNLSPPIIAEPTGIGGRRVGKRKRSWHRHRKELFQFFNYLGKCSVGIQTIGAERFTVVFGKGEGGW